MSPAAPCAPRWMCAVDDDPAPDAGPDLHEQQVIDGRPPARPVLAEGHHVHVVVHQHGNAGEPLAEVRRDRHSVPARHDRRADHPTGGELDGAGQADADPLDLGERPADTVEQGHEAGQHEVQALVGTRGDVQVGGVLDQDRAGAVADGHPDLCGAEVRGEDDATTRVERDLARGTAPGRLPLALLEDQPEADERLHPLGDGRAGESGQAHQVAARGTRAGADQLQHGPCAARCSHDSRRPPRHIVVLLDRLSLVKDERSAIFHRWPAFSARLIRRACS